MFVCIEYASNERATVAAVYGPFADSADAHAFGARKFGEEATPNEFGDFCNEDGKPLYRVCFVRPK